MVITAAGGWTLPILLFLALLSAILLLELDVPLVDTLTHALASTSRPDTVNDEAFTAAVTACTRSTESPLGEWVAPPLYAGLGREAGGVADKLPHNLTQRRLHLSRLPTTANNTCPDGPLDWLSHAGVLDALQGKHILFLGDSVTRFQFLNLARFVHTGWWTGPLPNLEVTFDFGGGWDAFSSMHGELFGGAQACDCSPYWANGLPHRIESHYYRARGVRLSFAFARGPGANISMHEPTLVNAFCNNASLVPHRPDVAAVGLIETKQYKRSPTAAAAAAAATAEAAAGGWGVTGRQDAPVPPPAPLPPLDSCMPPPCYARGNCGTEGAQVVTYRSWQAPDLVKMLGATDVVFSNTFANYVVGAARENETVAVVGALVSALGKGHVVWKSHTPQRHVVGRRHGCRAHGGAMQSEVLERGLREGGALMFDAFRLLLPLCDDRDAPGVDTVAIGQDDVHHGASLGWSDTMHHHPFVYRGMNEALLALWLPWWQKTAGSP